MSSTLNATTGATKTGAADGLGPLLSVADLRITFSRHGNVTHAVNGVNFEVHPGRTLAIIGESGSGKSVSVRSLMGLLPPSAHIEGSAKLDGTELLGRDEKSLRTIRGREIGMVFQDPATSLNPTMSIGDQVIEAIRMHSSVKRQEAVEKAVGLLRLVRLPSPEKRVKQFPHQLSGGMRQRIVIAIALASDPKLLIADEATTALDVTTQAQIMELLVDLQERLGMAIILISHDLSLAASYAHDVLVMRAGEVIEHDETRALFTDVQMPYTKELIGAIPKLSTREQPELGVTERQAASMGGGNGSQQQPVLSVRNLVQEFITRGPGGMKTGVVHAVSDVSFDLLPGETLGIVGETGSGKSTLARAIIQVERPVSGSVSFQGQSLVGMSKRDITKVRANMQMVYQDPFGSLNPRWKVADVIAEPLLGHTDMNREQRAARVDELLDVVGLDPNTYRYRRPMELSGGQAQRVAIARAVALEPALIICDEATSSLDVLIRAQVLDLFERLRDELNLAYLFIAHDLATVRRVSDRVAVMHLGQLAEVGPVEGVYAAPRHPYSKALLDSIPVLDTATGIGKRPVALRGEPPSPLNPPSGCRFRTRCPFAQDVCAEVEPEPRPMSDGHLAACHFPLSPA